MTFIWITYIACVMSYFLLWRPETLQAPASRDVRISAVKTGARCYCRPLSSNPLLQFPQPRLHLSLPCLGSLRFNIRNTSSGRPPKTIQHAGYMSCVYLRDSNPAGTGVLWGSRSPSWGPTATEIARPCRRRPCREPGRRWRTEAAGRLLAAPGLQLGGAAGGWSFGAVLLPVQKPRWRQPGGGAPRWSPPLTDMTRGWIRVRAGLNTAQSGRCHENTSRICKKLCCVQRYFDFMTHF